MTRRTSLDRARALARRIWPNPTPAERTFVDAVLSRFAVDTRQYSDILEWSLSNELQSIDTARFSYAFPSWPTARNEVAGAIRGWSEMLGSGMWDVARRLLSAARHPAVEQVLMGYARGTGERIRVKYYLQFRHDAGPAALTLARAMTGLQIALESDALPLHLVGLDVGNEGLSGAKLYFVRDRFDAAETANALDGWQQPLRNVLVIHRIGSPDDASAAKASELDFGLEDNAVSWTQLAASPAFREHTHVRDAFETLASDFRLRARRVSLSLTGPRKANVYYVLDEPSATAE